MFNIPKEIRQIAETTETPVLCPFCGTEEVTFTAVNFTIFDQQYAVYYDNPGVLELKAIGTAPGVLTAGAELICYAGHTFAFVLALDGEVRKVCGGLIYQKEDVSSKEIEIAARVMEGTNNAA